MGNKVTTTLSFCITCKNRFEQIKKTLPRNLLDNREFKHLIEFVLVDFGSADGLQDWIYENFIDDIRSGYLKYYYTEEIVDWHASIAKNTTHLLASNEIITNLDCDNYTGVNGGKFVIDKMTECGVHKTLLHQFSNDKDDGSYGRISFSRRNFLYIGGYDESFEPMGYQDVDLIIRLLASGLKYMQICDNLYNKTIPNTKEEGLLNVKTKSNWIDMNYRNSQRSRKNIRLGKFIVNQDKNHIGIIDNLFVFDI